MRKNSHNLYQNINELKNLGIVYLLVDLILTNVISDIEKCHQLYLQLFVFKAELNLHSLHRVGLHHQINILLKVVFHDFYSHLFFVVCIFTAFLCPLLFCFHSFIFSCFFSWLFLNIFCHSLLLLFKMNILDVFRCWRFFG